ncbi:MAG: efflux RND transporter periplasmic adaptor subunit [Cyclobacteriaceae bacterium]|jgi:cobalt-zinc-cadmium efflux system membrane fusion protein|nr:efflux RND transporter periplasmic adaptor subunit [Cyclobacteriaceae bacterium]
MKRSKFFIGQMAACIGVYVLVLSCQSSTENKSDDNNQVTDSLILLSAEQQRLADVKIGHITTRELNSSIKSNGILSVSPQDNVSVTAPFGGIIKSITTQEGSRVTKSEVIATVENPEFIQLQQEFLDAKNQTEFALADYERQKQLADENINAQKNLQQAKTAYLNWQLKVKGYEAKLKIINIDPNTVTDANIFSVIKIYAPISGYVTEVSVNTGKYINFSEKIFQMINTEKIIAELSIFERDLSKVKIGQKVRLTLSNKNTEIEGVVHSIAKKINTDRTIKVWCKINNANELLSPGLYVSASIETQTHKTVTLPYDGVAEFQGKNYIVLVYSVSQNQTIACKLIEVKTGFQSKDFVEIFLPNNVNENTNLLTKGAYAILSISKNKN